MADRYEDAETPWRDEDQLRAVYHDQTLTVSEAAERLGTSVHTLLSWVDRHSLQRRTDISKGPWYDREWLLNQYVEREKSIYEIAEEAGCDDENIRYWLEKHGIDRRSKGHHARKEHPSFRLTRDGYERVCSNTRSSDETDCVRVHRLVVVAHEGLEAVDGKDIHHENDIPWDNRPENLTPVTKSEHRKIHGDAPGQRS